MTTPMPEEPEKKRRPKPYSKPSEYERKLSRVMERLGARDMRFDYTRAGLAWVEFRYKGELYRFEHSVSKAQAKGLNLRFGSECFAQLVLSLEDLARMVERGIYDLSQWISGMKLLPAGVEVPGCFLALGFDRIPSSVEDVKRAYHEVAKRAHPDAGGSAERFRALQMARDQALAHFNGGEAG